MPNVLPSSTPPVDSTSFFSSCRTSCLSKSSTTAVVTCAGKMGAAEVGFGPTIDVDNEKGEEEDGLRAYARAAAATRKGHAMTRHMDKPKSSNCTKKRE